MAREKQAHYIDRLIQDIESISQNRCSLSDEDLKLLDDALTQLQSLRKKKGKTNKQVLFVIVSVVRILTKFLTKE